jgi:hypothetical protein
MPKYRFLFAGGTETSVVSELPDHEAAKQEALRTMAELDIEAVRNVEARDYAIKIYDEHENLVAVVTPLALHESH